MEMSSENGFSTPCVLRKQLTEKQKARISENFRAAKALLARKRPLDFPYQTSRNADDKVEARSMPSISRVKRTPLAEIPVNAISSSNCDYVGFATNDLFDCSADVKASYLSVESRCISDSSLFTPVKQREEQQKQQEESGSAANFSTPGVLLDDDDFDELVLKEIDALCELKSAAKSERQSPVFATSCTSSFQVKSENCSEESSSEIELTVLDAFSAVESMQIRDAFKEEDVDDELKGLNMPQEYKTYLRSMNDRQREAACSDISVPLMIVAGPGSGKTSTMVGRVLTLLSEGISPSNILAMTFTTAAASEMRDRIGTVAGKAIAKELTISTFHSFSLHLCRSHAEKLGRTPEFIIYGHSHQRRAIIEAVRLLEKEKSGLQSHDANELTEISNGMNAPELFKDKSKKWQKFVAKSKASGKTPEDCHQQGDKTGATILRNYDEILKSCNALDYHDLISCSVKLLTDFPEVFKESQDSWKAIVIDEFQDTSAMQYSLLRLLASHNRLTIVGDDDQSIFSFNGADSSGFDSFCKDFTDYKEIRLNKNYRSTRFIVEAASSVIRNNMKRCRFKDVLTDNLSGSKITIKECQNEQTQCAFVVDKILERVSDNSLAKTSYGNIAILYRRQVSGKVFQLAFRERKIPFNIHGVAFYRKKVVKAIIAMLRTTLPSCDDGPHRQVFKALLPFEKEEKKRVLEHIAKISSGRKCSFISAAYDIFGAKISGTFKRSQLTQGRKVLSTLEMISKLVHREQSISAVITSVANMVPQKYLLEQRAVVDVDGGKLLNEDNDIRSVLQYLLDDVSNFLSTQSTKKGEVSSADEEKRCVNLLKAFIDYITEREKENFHSRRHDNKNSVTLTTIHQSKGLEWDIVFIVKANESEIPLLHESNGIMKEHGSSIEEERRLLYVAMTRARKKLFILYVTMDSNWQMLQPSRFLKEIPDHLREIQGEVCIKELANNNHDVSKEPASIFGDQPGEDQHSVVDSKMSEAPEESIEPTDICNGNIFLRRFILEDRSVVSHIFHQWAKKQAFQNPKRLLDKVGFVIDERLRVKKNKHKDILRSLKACLSSDEAMQYAEYVLRWEQIPADQRAHMMREKQEHFQKLRIESSMSSSAPTSKQIGYLQNLGCTVVPTSRLHASRLIEQYKSL